MRELNFSTHNLSVDLKEVKRMFRDEFNNGCRYMIKQAFEKIMEDEMKMYLKAVPYERSRSRKSYRNGYRSRSLLTNVGEIDLEVPRSRDGGYAPGIFERYKRVHDVVDRGIKEMFLKGVSTRKVRDVLDVLCGFGVSAGYVSQVTKELDSEVRLFMNEPIDDDYAFLFLDALSVKIRYELKAKRKMVLVAYGVRKDGSRRLLSFRLAKSEGTGTWQSFLENLKVRGLKGHNLELAIMDGAAGLWAAIEQVYPLVKHQLCWVHKLRNVARYGPRARAQECVSEAAAIMYAGSSGKAARMFREWKRRWEDINPKGVACLERDFHRLIAFFDFDPSFHKVIRTTNIIERCFKEVRRRLKVMGYFQNTKSCKRIVMSLFYYFNSKWGNNRREIIEPIADYFKLAA
ncbi:MAG: IS256 family transposase [Candidatus Latescibacteria bacterium]|nr:IS256 family transposase [bacterium]MBD3423377.1 IS256 family transposase [Candidatus Latescibacterota bacterium]